jgi:hypothetical protein
MITQEELIKEQAIIGTYLNALFIAEQLGLKIILLNANKSYKYLLQGLEREEKFTSIYLVEMYLIALQHQALETHRWKLKESE